MKPTPESERADRIRLENESLSLTVSPVGAELRSLTLLCGTAARPEELLKREDDPDWDGCAPILFPICGRLADRTTTVGGTPYRMGTHGVAPNAIFTVTEQGADRVTLTLESSEETRAVYPFDFTLHVTYALAGRSLTTSVEVENRDVRPLPATVGFHPAFRFPLGGTGRFPDAYLEFSEPCTPKTWRLTAGGYLLDGTDPLPLIKDRILPLSEDLFRENDSVFLEETSGAVVLQSYTSLRRIRLSYAPAPYLGLWKPENSTAFLCVEPWYGTPDYDGRITELSEKRDMTLVPVGESRTFSYRIEVL